MSLILLLYYFIICCVIVHLSFTCFSRILFDRHRSSQEGYALEEIQRFRNQVGEYVDKIITSHALHNIGSNRRVARRKSQLIFCCKSCRRHIKHMEEGVLVRRERKVTFFPPFLLQCKMKCGRKNNMALIQLRICGKVWEIMVSVVVHLTWLILNCLMKKGEKSSVK